MAKTTAKLEIQPQTKDVEQFQLFLDGARKRGMNESLQDFALKFFQDHCGQGRRSGDLAETQVVRSPESALAGQSLLHRAILLLTRRQHEQVAVFSAA